MRPPPAFGLLLALVLAGCSNPKPSSARTDEPGPAPSASAPTPAPASDAQAPAADAGTAALPAPPLEGQDFVAEAKDLFRVAACGGEGPVPPGFDAAVVNAHCAAMAKMYAEYKSSWMDVAMPFLAKLVPASTPTTVVYPFGGGDLLGALATYPKGTDFTTVSLEAAASVRKVDRVPPASLKKELARYRMVLEKYFEKAHSRTDNLGIGTRSVLPGELVFDLVALELHGYEPTSLRYFHFAPDGTVKYVHKSEVDAADAAVKAKKKTRKQADAALFRNVELQFRKRGDAAAPVKILRHVAFNLDDEHMKKDGRLLKFLEAKGKVAAMTKAASHLLWSDDFSIIRNYLATHTDWMISDSTGFTPAYAKKMGFVQDTYGTYTWPEPFGTVDVKDAEALHKLFESNPHVDLSFRYGYPDKDHHGHIVVTRKPGVGKALAAADAPHAR